MYESFFGFKCKPFQLTPDPDFLFMSRGHKRALTYLRYGIRENYGFILLTGEIGTGKTTIIKTLFKEIPQDIKVARITNTKVNSEQLVSMINEDFGLTTINRDKTLMLRDLTDFLILQHAGGGRSVLIIDEAQNLTIDLLEEIRLLSNLETEKAKLLQIILIGQPELNLTLSRPELEQLRQRIAINAYISRLGMDELEDYIKHRLRVAGNKYCVRFEDGVIEQIFSFSNGIPRLVNIICEFALLATFADGNKVVDLELMKEVIGDFVNEKPETRASASHMQESPQKDTEQQVRESLMSIHQRLEHLEAALFEMKDIISSPGYRRILAEKQKKVVLLRDEYTPRQRD
jgi:general secretion pathway protein A